MSLFRIMLTKHHLAEHPLQCRQITLFLLPPMQRVKARLSIRSTQDLPHQHISLPIVAAHALLHKSIPSPQHHLLVVAIAINQCLEAQLL